MNSTSTCLHKNKKITVNNSIFHRIGTIYATRTDPHCARISFHLELCKWEKWKIFEWRSTLGRREIRRIMSGWWSLRISVAAKMGQPNHSERLTHSWNSLKCSRGKERERGVKERRDTKSNMHIVCDGGRIQNREKRMKKGKEKNGEKTTWHRSRLPGKKWNLLFNGEKVKRSQFALLLSTLIKHSLGYSFYSFRNLYFFFPQLEASRPSLLFHFFIHRIPSGSSGLGALLC